MTTSSQIHSNPPVVLDGVAGAYEVYISDEHVGRVEQVDVKEWHAFDHLGEQLWVSDTRKSVIWEAWKGLLPTPQPYLPMIPKHQTMDNADPRVEYVEYETGPEPVLVIRTMEGGIRFGARDLDQIRKLGQDILNAAEAAS